jgi:hypothetical protein
MGKSEMIMGYVKPLIYEEACWRWQDWAKANAPADEVEIEPAPQPNRQLSKLVGTTWHLKNVHGDLCKVTWNGRVYIARSGA